MLVQKLNTMTKIHTRYVNREKGSTFVSQNTRQFHCSLITDTVPWSLPWGFPITHCFFPSTQCMTNMTNQASSVFCLTKELCTTFALTHNQICCLCSIKTWKKLQNQREKPDILLMASVCRFWHPRTNLAIGLMSTGPTPTSVWEMD